MQQEFNYAKAYRNMPPDHRDLLVWLAHMMMTDRDVIKSLTDQAGGSQANFDQLKDKLDAVAEQYSSWAQCKWYLEKTDDKLPEVK